MIAALLLSAIAHADRLTLDLIFTIAASTGTIGACALALSLLPRDDREVRVLVRAFTPGWWR